MSDVRLVDHPLYATYRNMIKRCSYPWRHDYMYYGGRGIEVCSRWRGRGGFKCFLEDMGPKPSPRHSLDRINTDGHYEPENCRWATVIEQRNNMRSNWRIAYQGETLNLTQWAARKDLQVHTLRARILAGWSLEEAMETKKYGRKNSSLEKSKGQKSREKSGREVSISQDR